MNKHKFIKVQKGTETLFYRCNDNTMTGIDCFNFMRSDLNRITYNSLPSGSTIIDCSEQTTTSTTSTTTTNPCDIGFSSVTFVNNEDFPYDYNEQKGYILVDLVQSSFYRLYQIKILSGTTVIRDWTTPISSNNFSFKLSCANYKIQLRDYNDQSCISEINNINIPCLTTTTSGGSTTSTTSTTTSTSTTLTTSSTTTTPTYNPCGVFGNGGQYVYYYNPVDNTYSTIYSDWKISLDISFYNNKLYSATESSSQYILETLDLTNGSYDTQSITTDPTGEANLIARGQCHDTSGNFYAGESSVGKYTPTTGGYDFNSVVARISYSLPNSDTFILNPLEELAYIQSINCFLILVYDYHIGGDPQIWLMKADGSNLILRKYSLNGLGGYYGIRSLYVYNSLIYFQATLPNPRLFSLDSITGNITTITNSTLPLLVGASQNPSCNVISYSDDFYVSVPNMTCTDTTFRWTFDAYNGSGNYQYSLDNGSFTNVTGTSFDITLNKIGTNYQQQVYQVYIKDVGRNKLYQIMLDNRNNCNPSTTTTTTSTSTSTTSTTTTSTTTIAPCIPLSNVAISGTFVVYSDVAYEYSLNGSYNGSPVSSYLWEVVGGTLNSGETDTTANVTWNNSEFPTPYIYLTVTNCDGSVQVSRKITIQNLV